MADKVKVICYGKSEQMERKEALAFYKSCAENSDGAEKERYTNIVLDLLDGRSVAFDGGEPPRGYHKCQYCDTLTKGTDKDVLCEECQYDFGHFRFSEL